MYSIKADMTHSDHRCGSSIVRNTAVAIDRVSCSHAFSCPYISA